jgi:hypothetical protein
MRLDRCSDFGDDRNEVLRAVIAHYDRVGVARSDRPHQRPFAAVALAPASEYRHQAAAARSRHVLEGDERLFQRVGRVRVIHHDQGLPAASELLHASRDRPQGGERRGGALEGHAGHEHRRENTQEIGHVEAPKPLDACLAPRALR